MVQQYLEELERLRTHYQQTGSLGATKELLAEIARLEASRSMNGAPASLLKEVVSARGTFREASQDLEQHDRERRSRILKEYQTELLNIEWSLVREGDLDGAEAARRECAAAAALFGEKPSKHSKVPTGDPEEPPRVKEKKDQKTVDLLDRATKWKQPDGDKDWHVRKGRIARANSSKTSSLEYKNRIPRWFRLRGEIGLLGLGESDGKGVSITGANGQSYFVAINDDLPFTIYDVSAEEVVASASSLALDLTTQFKLTITASDGLLVAEVNGVRISGRFSAQPPFRLGLTAQRSGFKVEALQVQLSNR
ncbi:MAG TPA: hypothetical protein DCR55_07765 [Lentisphaeria bacterium]|nr:hypothetical protein [Lentisphaeria bacterium]